MEVWSLRYRGKRKKKKKTIPEAQDGGQHCCGGSHQNDLPAWGGEYTKGKKGPLQPQIKMIIASERSVAIFKVSKRRPKGKLAKGKGGLSASDDCIWTQCGNAQGVKVGKLTCGCWSSLHPGYASAQVPYPSLHLRPGLPGRPQGRASALGREGQRGGKAGAGAEGTPR